METPHPLAEADQQLQSYSEKKRKTAPCVRFALSEERFSAPLKKKKREFDWSLATFGQFLLKISYIGTNYSGLAWQPNENQQPKKLSSKSTNTPSTQQSSFRTIEGELLAAMKKTCIIRNRSTAHFSRCGRTDKGVHAAGNYVSARLRLRPIKPSTGFVGQSCKPEDDNFDYAIMLNSVLPQDIRVIDVRRVPDHFDARFQCLYRVYKYVFPRENFDIEMMRQAAELFIGEHDFRNFCKPDPSKVQRYRRKILWIKFNELDHFVWEVEIAGIAFLWHQVRCMMGILFLIGRGLESKSVITRLLDIEETPQKPAYRLASESGLILYDCVFEGIHFTKNDHQLRNVQLFYAEYLKQVQLTSVFRILSLDSPIKEISNGEKTLLKYKPLFEQSLLQNNKRVECNEEHHYEQPPQPIQQYSLHMKHKSKSSLL